MEFPILNRYFKWNNEKMMKNNKGTVAGCTRKEAMKLPRSSSTRLL